jgi:CheY-like chemotaxis protein
MDIYALIFLAGGLIGALIIYRVLRLRHAQTDKTKPPQSESLAIEPDKAQSTETTQENIVDLNAQRLEVAARVHDQRKASRQRRAIERNAAEDATRLEAQRLAAEETARLEAQRLAAEEASRVEAQRLAAEEAARVEAQRLAAEETARVEAQRLAAEETARLEAQRLAAEETARLEAQRLAAEETARLEAQRLAAEETARLEVQRLAVKNPADTLVMIVDDSKVGRIKTNRLLLSNQFQSQMAEDGRDAVNKIAARMPDIVITDVEMPEMDGFELTIHIRQNPATAHLPVIIISGNKEEYESRAKEVGADFILGKPYTDSDLMEKVRHYMQSGR